MVISLSVNAQTKTEFSNNEKINMNKKGEIYDHSWNKLGFIAKENIVKNSKGETVYFIYEIGNI